MSALSARLVDQIRAELEAKHGPVLSREQFTKSYRVLAVVTATSLRVKRRADGATGKMTAIQLPRFYCDFIED